VELPQGSRGCGRHSSRRGGRRAGADAASRRRQATGRSPLTHTAAARPHTHQLQQVRHVQRRQCARGGRVLQRQRRLALRRTRAAEHFRCSILFHEHTPQLVGALVGVWFRHLVHWRPDTIQVVLVRAIAEADRLVLVHRHLLRHYPTVAEHRRRRIRRSSQFLARRCCS
jgi:hypothetical protein